MKTTEGKDNFLRLMSWAVTLLLLALYLFWLVPAHARPTSYVTPFGPKAPWNVPVAGLQKHPQSDLYASRMYTYSPGTPGNFILSFTDYTYPVYYWQDGTASYTISGGYSTTNGNINGSKVQWNPRWTAAPGSDAQVILLDPSTGREWDLWRVSVSGTTISIGGGSLVPGSYLTKTDSWSYARGCGIEYLAMLVQPEEIQAGLIKHALSLPVTNTKAGFYVAPATKSDLDGVHVANPVPQGMRFALNVTDAQIESWVATKPAAYQKLARVVAHALRDYGWFVTDHSGSAHFQFEAQASADSLWKAQGIDPASTTLHHLLDGLITASNIYAIAPPPYTVTPPPPPPPPPLPCTASEQLVCETQYNSCIAACNQ